MPARAPSIGKAVSCVYGPAVHDRRGLWPPSLPIRARQHTPVCLGCATAELFRWARDSDNVTCRWEPWDNTPPDDTVLARIGEGMATIEFLHAFATIVLLLACELACVFPLPRRCARAHRGLWGGGGRGEGGGGRAGTPWASR